MKAELDRLQAFRTWIQGVGTPEVPLVGPIVPEFGGESESGQSTADFIEVGFLRAGNGASLTIPEILQWAEKAGWVTAAENPEQVIRTTVGRMMESQNPPDRGCHRRPERHPPVPARWSSEMKRVLIGDAPAVRQASFAASIIAWNASVIS